MSEEYENLVSDTLSFLKAETRKELLVSADSSLFFEEQPKPTRPVQHSPMQLNNPKPMPTPQLPTPLPESTSPVIKKMEPPLVVPTQTTPVDDIRHMLEKTAPHLKLSSNPAHDAAAKRLANAWKFKSMAKPVVILSLGQTGAELQFLNALADAVNQRLMPAAVVDALLLEKENGWEFFLQSSLLKYIFAPPITFADFPRASQFYKNQPPQLGKHPVLFFSSPAEYLHHPALKTALWKTLCQTLTSSQ